MKRYILFAFPSYYPHGGMADAICCFNSIDELEEKLQTENFEKYSYEYFSFDIENFQIYDVEKNLVYIGEIEKDHICSYREEDEEKRNFIETVKIFFNNID